MKKFMISLAAVAMMGTSAFGVVYSDAELTEVKVYSDGTIIIKVDIGGGTIKGGQLDPTGDTDARKAMLAAALTAKASGKPIDISNLGAYWNLITVK